ncbi:MAG: hypothetical protein IPI67_02210 [Myxococcales bacterium]|nr:hypothetical protein [Myxococcales bacterium]
MPCALVELRVPSLPLGVTRDGGVWLRIARSRRSSVRPDWQPLTEDADVAVRVTPDGKVAETLRIPGLVRVIEAGSTLVGLVPGADGDQLVWTRGRSGEGFDLRGADEFRAHGVLRAQIDTDYAVLDAAQPNQPCPVIELASGQSIGAFAPRKSEQFYFAVDAQRVYASSTDTRAWTRAGELMWHAPVRTKATARIAGYAGDLWLVSPHEKGQELLCLDGASGEVLRRSKVPPVHSLVGTAEGLLVGHELGVWLVRGRAGRPSSLLKARLDCVMTDGVGYAALSRETQTLFVARALRSQPLAVALARDTAEELDLAQVAGGHAVLRPVVELEEERSQLLFGDERTPRMGRSFTWVPLTLARRATSLVARRYVAEPAGDEPLALAAREERVVGALAEHHVLELSEADERLANALLRHGIVPKAWQTKLRAQLLRGEAPRLGSLLARVYADAPDKGQRIGFFACERLRQRGAAGLVLDLERLLRDEPVRVRQLRLEASETRVTLANGKDVLEIDLTGSDDPSELSRVLNQALEAAGSARRLLPLDAEPRERAFLLWEPARVSTLKRAGIKGVGKPL